MDESRDRVGAFVAAVPAAVARDGAVRIARNHGRPAIFTRKGGCLRVQIVAVDSREDRSPDEPGRLMLDEETDARPPPFPSQ